MNYYCNISNNSENFKVSIDFDVQEESWHNEIDNIKDLAKLISEYIFRKLSLQDYTSHIEYSIILTNDLTISEYNLQYRQNSNPTNVLSFPIEEIDENNFSQLPIHDRFLFLGDIIFSYETIQKEAEEKNIIFKNHFAHLLVHAILHCLGYDHENDDEAKRMENLEITILNHFNIKSPYEEQSN